VARGRVSSVLIANRGEIAVRVIRACQELGLRSVAVYSEADRMSPHVLLADEAHLIGAAPSAESYLRVDRILETAHRAGVDAIHPGYGFLSEQASFAQAVEDAGLAFVGPSPSAIAAMGDKAEARRRMKEAGVPIVPGTDLPLGSPEEAASLAASIGFPVLLKAVAGGGGKGMRLVEGSDDLPRALEAARREAEGAFGDDRIYLEKYLDRPRHIEIQLLGDGQGGVVHLGERECSIQRRHQKLVEEAPSPALGPELRDEMGAAAVRAAQALDYRGAGTVEFLYHDGENGDFFFLEMNTRIQVEHPVTEWVTGIDLVQWQLRVANGERLPFSQEDIQLRGHAIECRITAESPGRGFLPSTGRIRALELPSGPGVRWDGGIAAEFEVGLHYDPLLGKLTVHAPSRTEAIARMARALDELVVVGLETCTPLLRRIMDEPDFRDGRLSIRYLEDHPELLSDLELEEELETIAALAALLESERRRTSIPPRMGRENGSTGVSPWRMALDPWLGGP
jgi:acetyl-CoA carboxylase biotin carboxylase subunit